VKSHSSNIKLNHNTNSNSEWQGGWTDEKWDADNWDE